MPVISKPQKMATRVTSHVISFYALDIVRERGDAPMRIFSQPSTIDRANVASNRTRHFQKK